MSGIKKREATRDSTRLAGATPVLIVTGAASGVGCAIVERAAHENYLIVATDINREALEQKFDHLSPERSTIIPLQHDVTSAEDWDRVIDLALELTGRLDILVHSAGLGHAGLTQDLSPSTVQSLLRVNTEGVIVGTARASACMARQRSGHIIAVASTASLSVVPGMALYSATKHAVRAFFLAARVDLAPMGVTTTVVCLDSVDTPMLKEAMSNKHAAVGLGARNIMKVEYVANQIVEYVFVERPYEFVLPRSAAPMAKIAGMWPRLAAWGIARRSQRGLRRQGEAGGVP